MSKFYKLLIVSGFIFAGAVVFQNCGSSGGGGGSSAPGNVVTTSTLMISPTSSAVSPLNNLQFSASGGSPPYTYSVVSGSGTITSAGLFTAGSMTGLATVAVHDAAGSVMLAYVTVGSGTTTSSVLTMTPSSATVVPGGTVQLTAANGTPPYSYSMHAGDGSVNSTGLYTASTSVGSSIVMVTDNVGAKAYSYMTISANNGTTYSTNGGSNQICCPSGMNAISFTDIGTGRNHGITPNSPTSNCCTAWEGSANYGSPGCQITCN